MVVNKIARKLRTKVAPAKQELVFDLVLPVDGQLSAVIVHKTTKELVRTLFNNEAYQGGVTQVKWNGRNDAGQLLANAGDYKLEASLNPRVNGMQARWVGVIGNTSPLTGPKVNTAAHFMTHLSFLRRKGRYGVNYSEGRSQCHLEFDPDAASERNVLGFHLEHSITYTCADNDFSYWAGGQSHNLHSLVTATGVDGLPLQWGTRLNLSNSVYYGIDLDIDGEYITGMAVQQAGNFLYVAHMYSNEIRIFHKRTGVLQRIWYVDSPREITLSSDGTMWMLQGNEAVQYAIGEDGIGLATGVKLAGITEPVALGSNGTVIAVANGSRNNDPRQTANHYIAFYNHLTGEKTGELGRNAGYEASPEVADDKFMFANTKSALNGSIGLSKAFLTYDREGNLWVGDIGNLRCQKFSPTMQHLDTIQWLGYGYSCSADTNDPTRLFFGYHEFKVEEITLADGTKKFVWKFVRNWAAGYQANYDDDQNRMLNVCTLSNGRTYCLMQSQDRSVPGSPLQFVELTSGGMRYTGVLTDDFTHRLNSDTTLWSTNFGTPGVAQKWWKQTITFDASHNPVLGPHVLVQEIAPLLESDPITRGGGLGRDQVLADGTICTYSTDLPNLQGVGPGQGWHVGYVSGNRLTRKVAPSTYKQFRGGFNRRGKYEIGNRVQNGGSTAQVFGGKFFAVGYKGEFFQNAQTNMYNVWYRGRLVLQFGAWNSASSVLPDGAAGLASNANTGTWVKEGNKYVYYHCDEGFHAGIHRWEVTGTENLIDLEANVKIVAQQALTEFNFMGGVQMNSTLFQGDGGWERYPAVDAAPVNTDTFPARIFGGIYDADDDDPDLLVEGHSVPLVWTRRSWPAPLRSDATSYRLRGELGWVLNTFDRKAANQAAEFCGLRVTEEGTGANLLGIQRIEVSFPDDYRLVANGVLIAAIPVNDWHMLSRYLAGVNLNFTEAGIDVSFAHFPTVRVPYPAGVNWRKPGALELRFQSSQGTENAVAARKINYSTTPSTVFNVTS